MSDHDIHVLAITGIDGEDARQTELFNILEKSGIAVSRASGHEAGRIALLARRYDVVLIDFGLGRASCRFLLREGRTQGRFRAAFVLRGLETHSEEPPLIETGAAVLVAEDAWSPDHLAQVILSVTGRSQTTTTSNESAIVSDNLRREFVTRVSHEIRTPLHGILGAVELLAETRLTPFQRDYLQIVRNSSDALMSVVNDLMDYSKRDAHAPGGISIPFEPRACVEGVSEIVAPKARAKGLEYLSIFRHDVPARLKGDPNALRHVLTNLAGIAVRQAGTGYVELEMTLAAADEGHATLGFRIETFGNRLQPSDDDASLGKGFSDDPVIASCESTVAALGGELCAIIEPGTRARFEFTGAFEQLDGAALPIAVMAPDLVGREVLIVDDTATNRVVFREQLTNWGCEVHEAVSASEAMEVVHQMAATGRTIDIALIDFALPQGDGAAVARAFRSHPSSANAHLILCTSMPMSGDAKRMQDAGFEAYLTKPLRLEHLQRAMRLLLGSSADGSRPAGLITQHSIDESVRAERTVLYVENGVMDRSEFLSVLQQLEYPCDLAMHEDTNFEAASSRPYGVAVVECRAAIEEGLADVHRIRELGMKGVDGQRLPIIALLGAEETSDQSACLQAGCDAVLTHPIDPQELAATLASYLPGNQDARTANQWPEAEDMEQSAAWF